RHRRAGAVDRYGVEADRGGRRPAHAGRPEDHLPTQRWRALMPENDDDRPELPRGATPSELDAPRATVRVTPRSQPLANGLRPTETLVNMARALVVTRNKEQAVRALRKAMELSPDDPRVSAEFAALGLRRPPPIPWLPRSFFLNKWLGKLTWKWSRRERLD